MENKEQNNEQESKRIANVYYMTKALSPDSGYGLEIQGKDYSYLSISDLAEKLGYDLDSCKFVSDISDVWEGYSLRDRLFQDQRYSELDSEDMKDLQKHLARAIKTREDSQLKALSEMISVAKKRGVNLEDCVK